MPPLPQIPELSLALAATFVTVALLTGLVTSAVLARRSPERRHLLEVTGATGSHLSLSATPLVTADVGSAQLRRFIPKSPQAMSRLQKQLALAGYHGTKPLVVYCVSEVLLALTAAATAVYFLGPRRGMWPAIILGIVAYMLPSFTVLHRVRLRQKQIRNGLPDALDLMIVCLEAGLALDQAMYKASEDLDLAYPALTSELRMVNIETRAGKPRTEALRNFAKRTQVDDVRALTAMLVQTERFGTSVAQALRTHAETSRTKRRQRAEERAAKVSVKLVFPLVPCLFPAFYVVTLGPAVLQFVRIFFGQVVNR